jgi:hypothetical protein
MPTDGAVLDLPVHAGRLIGVGRRLVGITLVLVCTSLLGMPVTETAAMARARARRTRSS